MSSNNYIHKRCNCMCHAPQWEEDVRDDSWEYGVPCMECMDKHNPKLSEGYLKHIPISKQNETPEDINVGDEEHNKYVRIPTSEDKTECTLSPDCKCEDCKKETEEMNTGGADRW